MRANTVQAQAEARKAGGRRTRLAQSELKVKANSENARQGS